MLSDEECCVRPLVHMLDSVTTRDNVRKQILERLLDLLRKNETVRREFISSNGIEAIINTLNDNDNREIMSNCVLLLNTLVQNGLTKKLVLYNGTIVLFQLINRIITDDRDLSHSEILVKNVISLLINMRPKDPGFCLRCLNADGIGILLRVIKANPKVQLKALNLIKLVASYHACAREIVNSMALLLTFCTVPVGRRNTGQVKVTLQVVTKSIKTSKLLSIKSSQKIRTVVELISSWHKYDKKQGGRLLQIRKSMLNLLSAMTAAKESRNKVADLENMTKLYHVCDEMFEMRAPEQIIKQLITIMSKCLPLKLPPYSVINEEKRDSNGRNPDLTVSEEEIVPILEQFSNLRIFDQHLTENPTFLRHIYAQKNSPRSEKSPFDAIAPLVSGESRKEHTEKVSTRERRKLHFPKLTTKNRKKSTSNLKVEILEATTHSLSLPSLIPGISEGKNNQKMKVEKLHKTKSQLVTSKPTMIGSNVLPELRENFVRSQSFTALEKSLSSSEPKADADVTRSSETSLIPNESRNDFHWPYNKMWRVGSNEKGRVVNKNSPRNAFLCSQFKNSAKMQQNIQEFSMKTRTLDYNGKIVTAVTVPLCEIYGQISTQPANQIKTKAILRQKRLFENIERHVFPENYSNKLIYISSAASTSTSEIKLGPKDLVFDSNFESGNLLKAFVARDQEYDLWLNADHGMDNQRQWFFFSVKNMESAVFYKFNILNNEKKDSQFGKGMQPVIYSMKEAIQGNPTWRRTGRNITYSRNNFKNRVGKHHYTVSFEIEFPHENDTCYVAYHYPFTYSRLKADISQISVNPNSFIFNRQILCKTMLDNEVDLLTITALNTKENPIADRNYVIISARVHPGESNASWVMKGIIDYLTSETERADTLRKEFIFKLVPMLNPDGCVIGNHRTNYAKLDLNRQWETPTKEKSPSIYHLKGLMANLVNEEKNIFCYVDLHGHSVKKNGFLFGCDSSPVVLNLPKLMNSLPMFSRVNCRFQLTREKCARVVVYRRLGILRSYTLETTYNGCDQGTLANMQITEAELCELGIGLLSSIYILKEQIIRGNSEGSKFDRNPGIKDDSPTSSYSSDQESFSEDQNSESN